MTAYDSTKKWRVLQVVSSSATSGAERHLVLLSRTLQQQGHYVVTVCPPHNWLPQELQRAGVHTLPLPMRGAGSVMTLGRLVRVMREQRIDIIHTHLTRAAYYGLLLGLLTRKPSLQYTYSLPTLLTAGYRVWATRLSLFPMRLDAGSSSTACLLARCKPSTTPPTSFH